MTRIGEGYLFIFAGNNFMKFLLVFLIFFSAGCSIIKHSGELLVLKGVADDEAFLSKKVKIQDARFQKMLKAYESDQLVSYTTQSQFIKAFGSPVFERIYDKDSALEEWLYRYSTQFFNSPKIYVYFDDKGQKIDFHYEKGKE